MKSLPLRWLFGFDSFQAYALAMGALLIVMTFGNIVIRHESWEIPWSDSDGDEEVIDVQPTAAGDDNAPNEEAAELRQARHTWFSPCPCGSEKSFARCCGKRAFKRHSG